MPLGCGGPAEGAPGPFQRRRIPSEAAPSFWQRCPPGERRAEAGWSTSPTNSPAHALQHCRSIPNRVARLDVAFLHVLLLQGGAHIRDGDLLAGIHHTALHRGDVDEVAAREK